MYKFMQKYHFCGGYPTTLRELNSFTCYFKTCICSSPPTFVPSLSQIGDLNIRYFLTTNRFLLIKTSRPWQNKLSEKNPKRFPSGNVTEVLIVKEGNPLIQALKILPHLRKEPITLSTLIACLLSSQVLKCTCSQRYTHYVQ